MILIESHIDSNHLGICLFSLLRKKQRRPRAEEESFVTETYVQWEMSTLWHQKFDCVESVKRANEKS